MCESLPFTFSGSVLDRNPFILDGNSNHHLLWVKSLRWPLYRKFWLDMEKRTLWLEIQDGTAAMEKSMAVPQKIKDIELP